MGLLTACGLFLLYSVQLAASSPPFYGKSALGHTSPARGWNSFVAQSNSNGLSVGYVDSQCSFFYNNVQPGYDYICSFDSGWSVSCNGDDNGRILADPGVFSTMSIQDFAEKLHSNGMKLGIYMIPGAFTSDANKTVEGTNITIGSLFNTTVDGRTGINNNYNCRNDFIYSLDGVQQWHDSVVKQFVLWGVDFVKLDYITPGSSLGDNDGDSKPANDSGAVVAMHSAITRLAPGMRLDISWALDRQEPFFDIWKHDADTLRVDQDINAGNNPVVWAVLQRTLEMYRQFITLTIDPSPMMIRPDMDSLVVATNTTASNWSAFSTIERYSQLTLWLGAGANLILGSDLTKVDALGRMLTTHPEVLDAAGFTANWPMVPKLNSGAPSQLQAWIAGPNSAGTGAEAVVVLSNLGPDLGQGAFGTQLNGTQGVGATLAQLGIGSGKWSVRRVLGGGNGKTDFTNLGTVNGPAGVVNASLVEHETVLLKLTKVA
ncbi:family 27 glycoside hydrolase [Roridomyces roridus]|uniref:alpha-galactosidase n=1 Tax=Roridomyces roridus TaxID=1738132 RepID=A0AAD7FLK8_9AGAR|nr:family 27 glycoside hydrolase [Roridomyces roridus]